MPAPYRTLIQLIVFIGLCAAIGQALSNGSLLPAAEIGSMLRFLGFAGGAALAIYWAWRYQGAIAGDISLLTGALWDLVKLMETSARNAPTTRATGRRELLHHFAVDGAQRVAAGRPMPMGNTAGLDLTTLAFELMDRNDRDGSGYGRKVNSIRRGVFVFYAIVHLRKPNIAYRAMCEHMKTQVRLGEDGVENFTELKRLLGLPPEWPTDAAQIAALERRGLTRSRERAIERAVRKGVPQIFKGVQYVSPGENSQTYQGAAQILAQMREYTR
jgi:hypothetical protein